MSRFLGLGNGSGTLDLSSYTIISSSCSGTSGSTSLTATNASFSAGQRIFIHQTRGGSNVGKKEDNKIASYVAGTITLLYPLENDYTDSGSEQAQVVVVPEAGNSTGTLSVDAWDGNVGGLFVMALSGVADGTIDGVEKGFRGGARGVPGNSKKGEAGEGSVGPVVAGQRTANGSGGGGGQTSGGVTDAEGEGGGGGGYADDGSNGGFHLVAGYEGVGGNEVGEETNADIFLGAGGGGGGGYDANPPADTRGVGRTGGAAVVVYAHTLASTFSIDTSGVDGGLSYGDQGGGGSSSGGGQLIKCVKNLGATLTSTGGTSPGGARAGGTAADGRIRIETCSNTTGTEDPAASVAEGGFSYCGGAAFIF